LPPPELRTASSGTSSEVATSHISTENSPIAPLSVPF
jgi:hypothetical protein